MEQSLEALVECAKSGDQAALEAVLCRIQNRVYGLALRMLWHPADAEDASQEILIKVLTHLSTFRQESSFLTWVYHIASNHLLTRRKQRTEEKMQTFAQFDAFLEEALAADVVQELAALDRVAAEFRSHPEYQAPDLFVEAMRTLLASGQFQLLETEEQPTLLNEKMGNAATRGKR